MAVPRWERGNRKQTYSVNLTPPRVNIVRAWLQSQGITFSYFIDMYVDQVAEMIEDGDLLTDAVNCKSQGDMLVVTGRLLNKVSPTVEDLKVVDALVDAEEEEEKP